MTAHVNYQKLFDFQGMEVGYINRSHWAVRKPHILVELTPAVRKNSLSWLPLLEGEYASFQQTAQASLLRADLVDSIIDFPLHDLLTVALTSHDDYWAQRGLVWTEASRQVDELRNQLVSLMSDKRVSQTTRHAAKKLLFASPPQTK